MTAVGMVLLVWFGVRAVVQLVGTVVAVVLGSVLWMWEVPRQWRLWWALDEEAVVEATWALVARRGLRKTLDELVHGR
jgi:hypothetical protein